MREAPLVYNAKGLVSLYISWGNKQPPTDTMVWRGRGFNLMYYREYFREIIE